MLNRSPLLPWLLLVVAGVLQTTHAVAGDRGVQDISTNKTGVFVVPSLVDEDLWPKPARYAYLSQARLNRTAWEVFVLPLKNQTARTFGNDSFTGPDITKPFPGTPVDGWRTEIRVIPDVPMPEFDADSKDKVTTVSAISVSPPDSLFDGDSQDMRPIDPSWYICQHYFPDISGGSIGPPGSPCGYLSDQCISDIKRDFGGGFAPTNAANRRCYLPKEPGSPGFIKSPDMPESCAAKFDQGNVHTSVVAFMEPEQADNITRPHYFTRDGQLKRYSVSYGTGWNDRGNQTAFSFAANTTWLLVTVWGFSDTSNVEQSTVPEKTVSCLRANQAPPAGADGGGKKSSGARLGVPWMWVALDAVVALGYGLR